MATTPTIVTVKRPRDVAAIIESLGEILAGRKPDKDGIGAVFWSTFAFSLATSVYKAFTVKSHHGTDELGQSWPDLKPETKAYSRPDARQGLATYKGKPTPYGNTHRPTLTPKQDKEWRRIFVHYLAHMRTQLSESEARETAAASAWKYVKDKLGAKTILDYTSRQTVLLLQRSGRLEKSLRPGEISGERYSPPPEQVYHKDQTSLTWGTKVEYATDVDKKRPLWPQNIDPWIKRALDAGIESVIKKLTEVL